MFILTEKQAAFVEAYLQEPVGSLAAIKAGYSPATAATQASRLLRHPNVAAELVRRRGTPRAGPGQPKSKAPSTPPVFAAPPSADVSPLEFLLAVMRDREVDMRMRMECARVALPFTTPRQAARGKKETATDDARQKSQQSGRFKASAPPRLVVHNRDRIEP